MKYTCLILATSSPRAEVALSLRLQYEYHFCHSGSHSHHESWWDQKLGSDFVAKVVCQLVHDELVYIDGYPTQALSGGSMAQARMSLSILAGLLHLLLVQIQINHLSSYSRSTRHVEAAVLDYVLAFLQLSLSLTLLETTSLLLLERFCPWIS